MAIQLVVDDRYTGKKFSHTTSWEREGAQRSLRYAYPHNHIYESSLCIEDFYAAITAASKLPIEGLLSVRFCGEGQIEIGGHLKIMGKGGLQQLTLALSEISTRAAKLAILYHVEPALLHTTYTFAEEEMNNTDDT